MDSGRKGCSAIILLSQKEHMAATRISNSKPGFTVLASDEAAQMYAHLGEALRYAESVPEEVLRKAHPDLSEHWRDEYQRGLSLRIANYQRPNLKSEIEGSAPLDRFADWWNANKGQIRIPK